MDAIRKQLDVLMGANRNGDVREVNRKYEDAKAKGIDNYDRDLEDVIDRLIVECDRKITRALKRLEDEDAKAAIAISVSEVTQTPEVLELSKQIKEKLKEVDQYDLEGKTDMKIQALEIVEELRTKRADKQVKKLVNIYEFHVWIIIEMLSGHSMLLLDAFNKDRASLPQPLPNPPPLAPLPVVAPDARTQEMINEKLKKAEDLGINFLVEEALPPEILKESPEMGYGVWCEQGMIDEAQKALEEAEALKKLAPRQDPVLDASKYTAADVRITDQKLRVCDICGAFLSVYDSDRRLADHFGGKLHLGYIQIREKLAELQFFYFLECRIHVSCTIGSRHQCSAGINVSLSSVEILSLCIYQKSEAESMIGKRAGIETMEIAVKRGGTMIVGAEIVIGIMIVIMGMIESEIEKEIGPATMIQGVVGGHVHGQENVPGTMIATGVMIGTSCSWNEESGNCLSFVFMKINLSFWRDGFCDGTRNCLVHLHDYCLMKD
ncbi:hypothetical protein TEA_020967 [Camellia sinensis var. sinensis]|uniref:LUC7-related protein n=1 Tax=Camellia sinensis var. sinensis TaxID=542762 RepID=A0A4S4EB59_CAMSN|nr:hypothetical protein TEA_020967 [Camellia sinensis var. sinensis]